MRAIVAVSVWLVTAATAASAQNPSKDPRVAIVGDTAHVIFTDFSGVPLDLDPFSHAGAITDATILFAKRDGNIFHLLVTAEGPTFKGGRSGYCGGGYEANLIWLKVSHTAVLDMRTILYGSCAFSISGSRPQPSAAGLRLEYESYSEMRSFVAVYDHANPAAGLCVTSRPIKQE